MAQSGVYSPLVSAATLVIIACFLSACTARTNGPAMEIEASKYIEQARPSAIPTSQRIAVFPGGVRIDGHGHTFFDVVVVGLQTRDELWALDALIEHLSADPSAWASIVVTGEPVALAPGTTPPPPDVYIQPPPGWRYVVRTAEDQLAAVVPVSIKTPNRRLSADTLATVSLLQTGVFRESFRKEVDVFTRPVDLTVQRALILDPEEKVAPWDVQE